MNKKPLAWFFAVLFVGGLFVASENLDIFIVFITAVIVAKQIELLAHK